MRTPLKIMLATIVLAGLVAAPAFAAKPRTTVEILGAGTSNPKPLYFQGTVTSQKRYCEKERKVTLYRARSGKDKRVGAKRAEPDEYGGWVLGGRSLYPAARQLLRQSREDPQVPGRQVREVQARRTRSRE